MSRYFAYVDLVDSRPCSSSVVCAISIVRQILWSLCVTPQVGGSPVGVMSSPPVNGLEDPWPVSRRCLEPRWFVGDPTSLARDNIHVCFGSQEYHILTTMSCSEWKCIKRKNATWHWKRALPVLAITGCNVFPRDPSFWTCFSESYL